MSSKFAFGPLLVLMPLPWNSNFLQHFSIVAVHGLNGDPTETWTNPKTKAFWLKDYLPQDVANARVLSFGYNANAAFGNTTANISDLAKDLLSSLVTKRDSDNVSHLLSKSQKIARYADYYKIGASEANHFHCPLTWWNCGKASELL